MLGGEAYTVAYMTCGSGFGGNPGRPGQANNPHFIVTACPSGANRYVFGTEDNIGTT